MCFITASIIRRVYTRSPTGVGALARRYGSKNKGRGVHPDKASRGTRGHIR